MIKLNFNLTHLLLLMAFLFLSCKHSTTEPEQPPEPCEGLCGQALLQGYNFHEGIEIYNKEANELTQTDSKGNFELPLPDSGTYTLIATYAFFDSDTIFVEIKDSTAVDSLQFNLVQFLKPQVIPDTSIFSIDDTLRFTIRITNLQDRVVCGPERIRQDQLWLRDAQDTTRIFHLFVATRNIPRAIPYSPLETKLLRFEVPVSAYQAPTGTYQVWLADKFSVGPSQHICFMGVNVSTFGKSFGPAKGWATIKIE